MYPIETRGSCPQVRKSTGGIRVRKSEVSSSSRRIIDVEAVGGRLCCSRSPGRWLSSMKSKLHSPSGSETGCRPSGISRSPVVPTDDDPDELVVLGFALVWVCGCGWMIATRGATFSCSVTTCRVWYVNPSGYCEQREQKNLTVVPAST
jgi:hypothetical protein